ncbi:pyrroline-5-carboxylate dehydrogenase [Hyphomicrobium nitrativorans NL23]|uniref:Bifunctional protein PutA n=1 Tax=Hyphomicrobium nitrativorans NL23 TaxID=1029756 RepID=V5SEX9_9HYPH|nr:bifunctional proline dehydrogenase/L-glutamate gamma-semialdehyde dehydrogenase PutA [Hyphomicrobium nitrativorans]AHB49421.1 pyrroline-5-carboxylate dehydrogenase [Hyphomicrobium nitrativorans NL23]
MVALRHSEVAGSAADAAEVPPRDEIAAHHLTDETRLVGGLIERAVFTGDERRRASELARALVGAARDGRANHGGIDAFMREYGLSSEEGVILMCLAEALLRIPDADTADRFIAEKIAGGHWERHRGHSESLLVNASTWGLMLTGRLVKLGDTQGANPWEALKRLVARSGEPFIRQAVRQAVKLLGDQFVLGRSIHDAIGRSAPYEARGFRFSYDMLGEAAMTAKDAERYFDRYMAAIEAVGEAAGPNPLSHPDALLARPGLSVKLSALHPRYEAGKEARLADELYPRLIALLKAAESHGLAITLDAEEQDRLEVMLDLFQRAYLDPSLARWTGLGIAVQAYGKRAIPVIRWLRRLADMGGKRIPVRLVKGAYWDSEIKWAQERGLSDYPVLTRKLHTDVSYLACMRLVLSDPKSFYPQFATHNAHTIASAIVAASETPFEFQRLHGMGEAIYEEVSAPGKLIHPCRIYAPVGEHEDLLSYLVRRLLENGANTSFVNRLADDEAPIAQIVYDPVETAERERAGPTAVKPLVRPRDIFWPERKNSAGVALTDRTARAGLVADMERALAAPFDAGPIVDGLESVGGPQAALLTSPHDRRERLGSVRIATPREVEAALASAERAAHGWDRQGGPARARILDYAADLVERDRARLMAVLAREAGKTLPAALAEVRETVDLLRYYAVEARRLMSAPLILKGPTGETNELELRGRGPFACIAPWNFPLAIFVGQIAAALAAGNPVLAKPAEQSPVAAMLAVQLLHSAGVPKDVLHLLTGTGAVGAALVKSPKVKGVAFTGGNEAAWAIQKALADRKAEIVPLIAETGGLNAMIADSSALPEQVVRDAVRSAFDSAGQRCSALRVLFVQEEIASHTIRMLTGAAEALDVGDPFDYATDVGPVIDEAAQDALEAHKVRMQREGRELIDVRLPNHCRAGTYVTPAVYEMDRMSVLDREVFGPILHVVRFAGGHLPKVIEEVNATGYGLTLGLHSRIESTAKFVAERARVGNLYVNRNQIGAVPGVQPFGGEGLSGTGPKAGGPNYLARFATERVRSTDVTATGGNVRLLTDTAEGES